MPLCFAPERGIPFICAGFCQRVMNDHNLFFYVRQCRKLVWTSVIFLTVIAGQCNNRCGFENDIKNAVLGHISENTFSREMKERANG
jgi:hypothetical protein